MAEIWTPPRGRLPDADNLFDMIHVYQEVIDEETDQEKRVKMARFAVDALGASHARSKHEVSDVTVMTDFILLEKGADGKRGIITRLLGVSGIVDGISCVKMKDDPNLSLVVSIDALSVFPPETPSLHVYTAVSANVPIRHINSIESLAA